MKKLFSLLLSVLMVATMLTGCGGDPTTVDEGTENGSLDTDSTNEPNDGVVRDDVVICVEQAINDLDPVNWYLGTQSNIFQNVYSTLIDVVTPDATTVELRPNLAESWETEQDGAVWVFHLDPDAVFSNGDPVTADIVKECVERHRTNPYTMTYVEMIESVEVRDDHTVAFVLNSPWASAPYCWYMIAIFNTELYDADKEAYCKNPVGSGPYELTSVDMATGGYTLTLKDEWWGEKLPTIKTITIKTITDVNTKAIALESGEIDVASLSGSYLGLVMENDNLTKKEAVSIAGTQVFMNPEREQFSDKLVRQAIAYSLNYDALKNAVTAGYASPKDSTVKFATLDYDVPSELIRYSYDPEKARELLAQAGVSTPYNVGTIYGGNSNGAAEIVKQCLSEVGLEAEIVQLEGNTMAQAFFSGDYDIGITNSPGYVSAGETLMCLYGTGQTYNFSRFSNARVDELIQVAMTTQDQSEYQAAVDEALGIVVEECTTVGVGIPSTYTVGKQSLNFSPMWSGLDMIEAHW